MTLRYTRRALEDLDDIRRYTAAQNPSASWLVAAFVRRSIGNLTEWPYRGRATDRDGIRRLVVSTFPYVVFYTLAGSEIVILRVMHARRDQDH